MKKKDKDLLEAYQLPKNPSSDGYYHINVKAIHTGTGKRKQLTAKTLKELKEKLLKLNESIGLVVIQIGDDAASSVYVRQKNKMATDLNYKFQHIMLMF